MMQLPVSVSKTESQNLDFFFLTYPFISDDLVSFLLQLVETQPTDGRWILRGFGLLIGRRGTPGGTCGGDVFEV